MAYQQIPKGPNHFVDLRPQDHQGLLEQMEAAGRIPRPAARRPPTHPELPANLRLQIFQ